MARHRPGIAETKIDIAMSIHIKKVHSLRLTHKWRKRPSPLHHPVHGHAAKQRLASTLKHSFRFRTVMDVALLLALHKGLQTTAVNGFHGIARSLWQELWD